MVRFLFRFAIGIIAIAFIISSTCQKGLAMQQDPLKIRQPVPQLPDNLEWLNTQSPLTWQDLRGKFVLLDFWTYCCINCMHIIPELKKLEAKYPRELVVIGVHSAKFEEERDTQNIMQAALRYGVEHPIINDNQMLVWRRFGVSAWPTLVLIDPEGFVIWAQSGETTFEALDDLLRSFIPIYERRGTLDRTPLHFETLSRRAQRTPLRFPGKVLADAASRRLFIADGGHNRIVIASWDGELIDVVGSGEPGLKDGPFEAAQFSHPQGMALLGDVLLVADTENHAIRAVDLKKRVVRRVAGTGQQLRRPPMMRMTPALTTDLASPWDLLVFDRWVYIAMAGCHQIWRMDTNFERIGPYAGSGREDIVDGPMLPPSPYAFGFSAFAQPSGLATDGQWLYVADSEGSSIRAVPLQPRGEVRTVVGTSRLLAARLFTFGDRDGPAPQVLLQHPLGVVSLNGFLYIADTYNNKIKRVHPQTGETVTIAGDRQAGFSDDPPRFDEPGGLSAAEGVIFIADTNNHAIRRLELNPTVKVTTLEIRGLQPPPPAPRKEDALADVRLQPRERVVLRPDSPIKMRLEFGFDALHGLNPEMPVTLKVRYITGNQTPASGAAADSPDNVETLRLSPAEGPLEGTLSGISNQVKQLEIVCVFYWCQKTGQGVCRIGTVGWRIPIDWLATGQDTISLRHQVN